MTPLLDSWQDTVATLDWCRRWVGYNEEGKSNRTIFAGMAGHRNGFAWCATFISAAMKQMQVSVPAPILVASSRTMFAEAKKRGLNVPMTSIRAGDVVHMTRGSVTAWLGHVGIVESVEGDTLVTIEGNTNSRGSATGGSVLRHRRSKTAWNLGAWRPDYKPANPNIRFILKLDDGRLVAWKGEMQDGKRAVTHVPTIPAAEVLLASGFVQVDYSGPVFVK